MSWFYAVVPLESVNCGHDSESAQSLTRCGHGPRIVQGRADPHRLALVLVPSKLGSVLRLFAAVECCLTASTCSTHTASSQLAGIGERAPLK
jgi:hypothetical protein